MKDSFLGCVGGGEAGSKTVFLLFLPPARENNTNQEDMIAQKPNRDAKTMALALHNTKDATTTTAFSVWAQVAPKHHIQEGDRTTRDKCFFMLAPSGL